MKTKKEFKVGDILFGVDIVDPTNYSVHDVEIISFDLTDDDHKCGWNVKCEILSDDVFNGATFMTHTDRLFKTRKEALEYVLSVLTEKQLDVTIATEKVQKELNAENERLEKQKAIKERAALIRKRLFDLSDIITELFKDPLKEFMFEDVEETSEFACALDVLLGILSYELERNRKGWDNLIKEILNSKDKGE